MFNEVEQEDVDRQSTVQDILRKSKDFFRRIIEGQGGSHLVVRVPALPRFPLEDYTWWISSGHGKKVSAIGGALRAAASTTGGTRTES